jgi:hypothetical protein
MFNIYDTEKPIAEIKAELGWWQHGESPSFAILIEATMMLCDRIEMLQNKVRELEQSKQEAA